MSEPTPVICEAICLCEPKAEAEYCWDFLLDPRTNETHIQHHQRVCVAGAQEREPISAAYRGYYRLHSLSEDKPT